MLTALGNRLGAALARFGGDTTPADVGVAGEWDEQALLAEMQRAAGLG